MPLRRTKRSDGRPRPRWKDGSHFYVESTHANESRCNEIASEPNRQTEPLVTVPQLLKRSYENNVSTRDRLAGTGADARIEESVAIGEVRLALRPYGRKFKLRFIGPDRKRSLNFLSATRSADWRRDVQALCQPRKERNCSCGLSWSEPKGFSSISCQIRSSVRSRCQRRTGSFHVSLLAGHRQ